jgi:hypothetical protein
LHIIKYVIKLKLWTISSPSKQFTTRGVSDYENIQEFTQSIANKLRQELSDVFVRPILLNDGSRTNALFLLTKHLKGLMLFNSLAWKYTEDGMCLLASQFVAKPTQQLLFDFPKEQNTRYISAQQNLESIILAEFKQKRFISNAEIIALTAVAGFLPHQANEIIKKLYTAKFLQKTYLDATKQKGFYIAEEHWKTKLCLLEYQGERGSNAND